MMVLFLVFFQIGLFSVGGGYAAMPLIQSLVVESHGWLTMAEFTNLMTIAEMTPGPIAVNSATFVGMRCAGLPGALVATFGCITPSLILVTLLSYLYGRFRSGQTMQNVLGALRPVVVALIASAALSIAGCGSEIWWRRVHRRHCADGRGVPRPALEEMEPNSGDAALRRRRRGGARGRLAVTKIFRNHLSGLDRDWCVCYTPNRSG